MNLENGDQVSLWDRVKFLEGENGIVLFSIDDDQYSPCYPKEQWTLLKHGLMLDSTFAGWYIFQRVVQTWNYCIEESFDPQKNWHYYERHNLT